METYAISVKRSQRDAITLNEALDLIRDVSGVRICDARVHRIALIEADDRAIQQVVSLLSPTCHIESQIRHRPQTSVSLI